MMLQKLRSYYLQILLILFIVYRTKKFIVYCKNNLINSFWHLDLKGNHLISMFKMHRKCSCQLMSYLLCARTSLEEELTYCEHILRNYSEKAVFRVYKFQQNHSNLT